jgi:hypothetical protein
MTTQVYSLRQIPKKKDKYIFMHCILPPSNKLEVSNALIYLNILSIQQNLESVAGRKTCPLPI